jgi:hypothetical protein
MTEIADRIAVDPEQCGGRPCVRGMRIRVTDVLDLLARGLTQEQVIEELPTSPPRTSEPAYASPATASTIPCWPLDPLDRRPAVAPADDLDFPHQRRLQ